MSLHQFGRKYVPVMWNIQDSFGNRIPFAAPMLKEGVVATEGISCNSEYVMLSRFLHILRCIEGYFCIMASMDDKMGMALFGLATSGSLQFLKFEYDNFSGYEVLSIPRPIATLPHPIVSADPIASFADINQLLCDELGKKSLGLSKITQRLLCGRFEKEDVPSRQAVLYEKELEISGMPEKGKTRKFVSWIGRVEGNLYREYRIDASITMPPGCFFSTTPSIRVRAATVLLCKRMREKPQYEVQYTAIINELRDIKAHLFTAMLVSSYLIIHRFEEENFASDYEWTKPKPLDQFYCDPDPELVIRVDCNIEELSYFHFPSADKKNASRDDKKMAIVKKCIETLETSADSIILYANLMVRYCQETKTAEIVLGMEKVINGLFYAMNVMQHCEYLHATDGKLSDHFLIVILHCLDTEHRFTSFELSFLGQWNFNGTIENLEAKRAYAVNFLEFCKRETRNQNVPLTTRRLYKKIYQCIPKLGKFLRQHTQNVLDEVPISGLALFLRTF